MSNHLQLWTARHRLGLRFLLPLIWGAAGCSIAAVSAKNWQTHTNTLQAATHAALSLATQSEIFADACISLADVRSENSVAQADQVTKKLDALQPRLDTLSVELSCREDLQGLSKNLREVAGKVNSREWTGEEASTQIIQLTGIFNVLNQKAISEIKSLVDSTEERLRYCLFAIPAGLGLTLLSLAFAIRRTRIADKRLSRLSKLTLKRYQPKQKQQTPKPAALQVVQSPQPVAPRNPESDDLIEEFLEKLAEQVTLLRHATNEENYTSVASVASWLSGAAGTFGFDQFTGPSIRLEESVINQAYESIDDDVREIEGLLQDVHSMARV